MQIKTEIPLHTRVTKIKRKTILNIGEVVEQMKYLHNSDRRKNWYSSIICFFSIF